MEAEGLRQKECHIGYTMNVIGGKWKIKILYQIYMGEIRRYGELKKLLPGITHKMLSQQLKELQKDALISRKEYNQIPPKVEYCLTEKGGTLLPILSMMNKWGEENENCE